MAKSIALPQRRPPRKLDDAAVEKLEAAAEAAGGGHLPTQPMAVSAPVTPVTQPPAPALAAPTAAPPPSAVTPADPANVPSAFAELLASPRGVARGRGTVADPRVRIIDGRAVRASTIHLPVEMYDRVDEIARVTGRSRSSVIEWALQKLLTE